MRLDKPIKLVVIDDEATIRKLIQIDLESKGYCVFEAATGEDGLKLIFEQNPDVVLLDLGLLDQDGLRVLLSLREWSKIPVVVLTVRDSEEDKVKLLEAGADDYLTKPFSLLELSARLKVALRHGNRENVMPLFKNWRLEVDFIKRIVKVEGNQIKLTATEYDLLRLLIQFGGRVVTQQALLQEIWGPSGSENPHYIRVYVGQLRKKIEADAANPQLILTEPGIGYRFFME